MSYIRNINDNSKEYKEYGKRVLSESKKTLNKAGIKVFRTAPEKFEKADSVVINNENNQKETNPITKKETTQKETTGKSAASWIRQAMPTAMVDPLSISNDIYSNSQNELSNAIYTVQNYNAAPSKNTDGSYNTDDYVILDNMDLFVLQESTAQVDQLSNASNDEGDGNTLRTIFEKDIPTGFSTNNYAGTKYERNITKNTSEQNVTLYSDNSYSNGKTSILFGGTVNKAYKSNRKEKPNLEYNVYAFLKQKDSNFTYGVGGIANKNEEIKNININAGTMHNGTNIFAILKKNITVIPGLPTHTATNIDVGIGKASGLLNPDEYNKKDKSLEEINKINAAADYIENKRNKNYEVDENSVGLDNAAIELIILNTDEHKEYGIKGGYIFRQTSDKNDNNYAFVMPFGAISNINIDSKEGAKFMIGAHAGQNITFGNGWHIKTKALVKGSVSVLSGNKPNDFIIANAHVEADKNKFSGQFSTGTFFDNAKKFCRYAETELNYTFNRHWNANAKAGIASYKFSAEEEDKNKLFQIVAGVRYSF